MALFMLWAGFAIFWMLILWITLGLIIVKTGTVAAVFWLGKFAKILRPGPHLIIPVIHKVEIYPTSTIQMELPDEPENIDRSDTPTLGKKIPHRIVHKGRREALYYVRSEYQKRSTEYPFDNSRLISDSGPTGLKKVSFKDLPDDIQQAIEADSAHAPLTPEWPAVFEWNLRSDDELSIKTFIENVTPQNGYSRMEEVRRRADDVIVRIIQEELTSTTVGHAIYMSRAFNQLFKDRLEELVGESTGKIEKPWGIQIGQAFFKEPNLGKTVNQARSDAAAADSNKQAKIRDAETKKETLRLEGEGEAAAIRAKGEAERDAEIARGQGEAGRIKEVRDVMSDETGKFIAALDVAETVLPKAQFVVVPADDKGVLGSIIGAIASKK